MTKHVEDWSTSTLSSPPTGWTARWNSGATYAVEADTDGISGRRCRIVTSSQARRLLSWDALDGITGRADYELRFLCRAVTIGTNATGLMLMGRGAGAAASETSVGGGFSRASSQQNLALLQYSAGSSSFLGSSVSTSLTAGALYWLHVIASGTAMTARIYSAADPTTQLYQHTGTTTVSGDGWLGLFTFANAETWDVLGVTAGFGGDAAPIPVGFFGTVGTLNGEDGVAFSQDIGATFVGSETRTYALQAGSLAGSGLTLDTGTGVISGATPVAGTYSGLVVRATDALGIVRDTNSFAIQISAGSRSVQVTLYNDLTLQTNITGIKARWWDDPVGTGAPTLETAVASTNASGVLTLDIDAVTSLTEGQVGLLYLYKAGADALSDLHFGSRLAVQVL